jgi:hypothetical protein
MPLAKELKEAIDHYLKVDRDRRRNLHSDGQNAFIFQPLVNYRTLEEEDVLSVAGLVAALSPSGPAALSCFGCWRQPAIAKMSPIIAILFNPRLWIELRVRGRKLDILICV